MIRNLLVHKVIWMVSAVLATIVSAIAVWDQSVYKNLIASELMPGGLAQDLITIVSSMVLLGLVLVMKEKDVKKQIVAMGILGYLFYAYGIFVIERVYNWYYLIYVIIFALSFWGLVYGVASIKKEVMEKVSLSKKIRMVSFGGAMLQPVIFVPLWTYSLIPLMQERKQIDNLFSIYILDLVFIMPAFAILAIMLLKNKEMGILLAPVSFILGFVLILSLAIAELVKPYYGMEINWASFGQALGLVGLFVVLGWVHLGKMRV